MGNGKEYIYVEQIHGHRANLSWNPRALHDIVKSTKQGNLASPPPPISHHKNLDTMREASPFHGEIAQKSCFSCLMLHFATSTSEFKTCFQ